MSESDAVGELRRELETAKCTIVQLQQQLAAMEQLLRQERVAREQAEAAAQQAAHAAEVAARAAIEARRQHHHGPASASTDQELISMELMLQQERAARREAEHAAQQAANAAEVAARAALEATRHHPVPAPVAVEENGRGRRESTDFEMEDVSDPQQEIGGHGLDVDSTQEPTKSRGSSASKARGPSKKSAKALSNENKKKKKMSLAEVRKAAQEETERRMKERAKVLSSKKGKRDILLVTDAGRKVRVKQVEEGSQRSIAEMQEIIQREREARLQAQRAAEQALTAAKEAQKVILELEQELERKDQQLEQERAAREQIELAAQRAAIAAEEAVDEHNSSPVKVERDECVQAQPEGETEESNTDDDVQSPLHAATTTDKSSPAKRPREGTDIQSPPASKKPRGPNKDRIRASQGEASKQKMSLEEARKAAQEEIEKRVEERAKQLSSKK